MGNCPITLPLYLAFEVSYTTFSNDFYIYNEVVLNMTEVEERTAAVDDNGDNYDHHDR